MYWTKPENLRDFALRNPLVAAFAISLVIHTALFGTWRLGKKLGWWEHQATWLLNLGKKKPIKISAKQLAEMQAQQRMREIPLTFVEVDPVVAITEPPRDAKFYGAHNAKAANPEPQAQEQPKVDGKQTQIVKTETTPKLNPQPLQPSLPPDKAADQAKPKSEPIGDLGKAALEPEPVDTIAIPSKDKPRTLAAARERKNIVGEKMKQDGGTKRRGQVSFDVKATPFGAYDAAFIAAVQTRWYQLLDSHNFAQRSGKVVVEFRLSYNGQISDMRIAGNEVGDVLGLLCQRAIKDPAPYAQWPADMRRMIGGNHRDVTFTFYYN